MQKSTPSKSDLSNLSSAMINIHKILTDDFIEEIQRTREETYVAGQKLNMLLTDPEFQWLRPLSLLIADVDDVVYQKEPIVATQTTPLIKKTKHMFFEDTASKLYQKVHGFFETSPDIIVCYAQIKAFLVKLEQLPTSPQ